MLRLAQEQYGPPFCRTGMRGGLWISHYWNDLCIFVLQLEIGCERKDPPSYQLEV